MAEEIECARLGDTASCGDDPTLSSTAAGAARSGLAAARELHRDGRDEEAVDILVEWLDSPPPTTHDDELNDLLQAMVALGCWLCNTLATRHLHARRVARAFGYTRTCERWLSLRQATLEDDSSAEMWARLRYDRALNAAELAQSSGDRPKAVAALRECERLQAATPSLPDPEAVQLCLAEVLLQSGRRAEAVAAANLAMEYLRRQTPHTDERKVYSLLFAFSLEQAALAGMPAAGGAGPPPMRALRCLPEAEAAWAMASCEGPSPGFDAARQLLAEMRNTHERIMQQASVAQTAAHNAARAHSAPRLPIAGATSGTSLPSGGPVPQQRRPWTSPSNPSASRRPAQASRARSASATVGSADAPPMAAGTSSLVRGGGPRAADFGARVCKARLGSSTAAAPQRIPPVHGSRERRA